MKHKPQNQERARTISLDDIVFRGRNKDYGAYELRQLVAQNTGAAFSVTIVLLILLFMGPTVAKWLTPPEPTRDHSDVTTDYTVLPEPEAFVEEEEKTKPLPPEPTPPPERSTVSFATPEVTEAENVDPLDSAIVDPIDDDREIGLKTTEASDDEPASIDLSGLSDGNGKKDQPVVLSLPKEKKALNEWEVNQLPKPVNMDKVKGCIVYPQMAKEAGVRGQVSLRVMIDETGRVVTYKVMHSEHKWLTDASVKCIDKLRCTPAIQNGKPVACWMTVPFQFKFD